MFDQSDQDLTLYLAGCTLARVPGNQNWLEEKAVGGLPEYICRIARAIHEGDASKTISQVIAIAVSRVKVWASGGGGVTAKTRAKAAKAVAEWEAKKSAAKLDNKVKASNTDQILNLSSYNIDDIRRQYRENYPASNNSGPYRWIREMWSDYLIVNVEDSNGAGISAKEKFVKVPYSVDKDGKATFGEEVAVKQQFVPLSNLECSLTDAQLELAGLIPCTSKANRSLLDNVRLTQQLRMEHKDFMRLSANVRKLMGVSE
jgi:hypothetical protein